MDAACTQVARDLLEAKCGLAICARGMSSHLLMAPLIEKLKKGLDQVFVFILNTSPEEAHQLSQVLPIQLVEADKPEVRQQKYGAGGIFVVSRKILMLDLLGHRFDLPTVDALLVNHAHQILKDRRAKGREFAHIQEDGMLTQHKMFVDHYVIQEFRKAKRRLQQDAYVFGFTNDGGLLNLRKDHDFLHNFLFVPKALVYSEDFFLNKTRPKGRIDHRNFEASEGTLECEMLLRSLIQKEIGSMDFKVFMMGSSDHPVAEAFKKAYRLLYLPAHFFLAEVTLLMGSRESWTLSERGSELKTLAENRLKEADDSRLVWLHEFLSQNAQTLEDNHVLLLTTSTFVTDLLQKLVDAGDLGWSWDNPLFENYIQVQNHLATLRFVPTDYRRGGQAFHRITVYQFKDAADLWSKLHLWHPSQVVVYQKQYEIFRTLQMYTAREGCQVHILGYSKSFESFEFDYQLIAEKQAFQRIPDYQRSMLLNFEDKLVVSREDQFTPRKVQNLILVDSREFNSVLPIHLVLNELDVLPLTISVGDYILTPEMGVERKSEVDLVASLLSGRLFNQAKHLVHHYPVPLLLIELPNLRNSALFSENSRDLTRLLLFIQVYPTIGLLWTFSPHFTGNVFKRLKAGRPNPDAAKALGLLQGREGGPSEGDDYEEDLTHSAHQMALEILRKLPGVTPQNLAHLTAHVKSLKDLSEKSVEDLKSWMGLDNATLLYNFLHVAL